MAFDWPDRPKASPTGGALIQSRSGTSGHFEVVIPWPNGGLAYFWRDNDESRFRWHGPIVFGDGRYLGASITEGFNKFVTTTRMGNFEVVAVRDTGEFELWFRENGGQFRWHRAGELARDVTGVPALTFTGAHFKQGVLDFDLETHLHNQFWAAVPNRSGGFSLLVCDNDDPDLLRPGWRPATRLGRDDHFPGLLRDRQFVGVGLALTCLHSPAVEAWSWKEMQESAAEVGLIMGDVLVAATSTEGALTVFVWNEDDLLGTPPGTRAWRGGVSLTTPVEPNAQELRPFRGRPALLQSDYDLDEETSLLPFEHNHFGNLELLCAAKRGGIHHLWRDNGGNTGQPASWEGGWKYAGLIGDKVYDEVSVIQSRFGRGEHGNLEMIARASDQAGFDFYWRDENFRWHGPHVVTAESMSVTQPLVERDNFADMLAMGIDFSVPETDLRSWLKDPQHTPYPAITEALQFLFDRRRLERPAFLDVIVFNYEHTSGITSPRSAADVSLPVLTAAVLAAHNIRHGERVTNLEELF
ncbi:hypothetical protein [Kineococcus glutinatus]|uniref:Uncharacterized protein n=1 Tax=Kineococcus glutinatus TaxID=1070872 RepID=A0ABP9HA27_9ACTN